MPTPIKILLFVLAGGLIGYSCSPSPSAFDVSTRVSGWAGVFLVIAVVCVAFMDAPTAEDETKVDETSSGETP